MNYLKILEAIIMVTFRTPFNERIRNEIYNMLQFEISLSKVNLIIIKLYLMNIVKLNTLWYAFW